MTVTATEITPQVAPLCDRAWDAFCEDIAGMFDLEIRCVRRQAVVGAVRGVQEQFPKLTAAHFIQAQGALTGTFSLLFDAGGVFVLGGVIIMLPEPRILEGLKRGSLQGADSLLDAAREAGNLLVGSWDRVFRTDCPGHKHFLKTGTFIGRPWEGSGPPELQSSEPAMIVRYEMTIASYPSFTCAAVLPQSLLAGLENRARAPVPAQTEVAAPAPPTPVAAPAPAVVSAPEVRPASAAPPTELARATEPPAQDPQLRVNPPASAGPSDLPVRDPVRLPALPRPGEGALAEVLDLPVAAIMEKEVVWAQPEESVQEVLAHMQQHNVGYVLVGRGGVLEGLVSSSNILGAVSLYLRPLFAQWRRAEDDATLGVKVKWIMSRPVRTVRPDAPVAVAIESMRRCGGRCLPVVDAHGTVQGLVTVFDILLRLLEVQGAGVWQGRPPQAPALLL